MSLFLPLSRVALVEVKHGRTLFPHQFFRKSSTSTTVAAMNQGKEALKQSHSYPSTDTTAANDDVHHTKSMTETNKKDGFVFCTDTKRIVPSLELARLVPVSIRESPTDVLLVLAAQQNHEACAEVLTRHIMSHDNIHYADAEKKVDEIRYAHIISMEPYAYMHLGVGGLAVVAGLASFPLVFDYTTVMLFNERFVTDDVPPAESLETVLEVGSWSWSWMEPIMGQLSFFILCMQFAYTEFNHIGKNHFHHNSMVKIAEKISDKYPQYNKTLLMNFFMSQKFFGRK